MTMFPRRVRPRPREGDQTIRRPKRVKTFHTAEDQVIQEFQDILGHLRSGDIGGPEIPQYDGGMEANGQAVPDLANPPEDALPEANLKSVPHDPSLQALWIAREIKKLAVYNERYNDRKRVGSISTTSPISPTFSLEAANTTHVEHDETPDSSLKRLSGRKRRQTSKAQNSHLVDLDVHNAPLMHTEANRNPMDGVHMLSALVTNQRVQHALLYSVNLGPGNLEKRSIFGTQFLQSMAADTLPPDPMPAARLKHSLWRSRNHVPFFAALHILAGFGEVVQAIDVAFQGRLDDSDPLTRRDVPLYDYAQPNEAPQTNIITHTVAETGNDNFASDLPPEKHSPSTRLKLVHRKPQINSIPTPSRPNIYPGIAPRPIPIEDWPPGQLESLLNPAEPEDDREESITHEATGPTQITPIDPRQSRKAIDALTEATAILDDMAYGALKYSFMPPANDPPNNQYHTPYGPPGPNTYVTPYTDSSPSQQQQGIPGPMTPQQVSAGPVLIRPNAIAKAEHRESSFAFHGYPSGAHDMAENIPIRNGKGKERAHDSAPVPNHILESTETAMNSGEATNVVTVVANQEDGDDQDELAQIDSFLALAAGDDSDSDDETDRDRTISREMTPFAPFPADLAVDSIVRGIVGELITNQNWGHGIGFLTPQTHLYQISNAGRFAEGLTRCIDAARISVNCVLSAEHSRTQEAFYDALIKRITNPYTDGTLPRYSNVVYHNGRAYQAIPGPAHPMYQQQLPYPPPPPASSQMMLPSPNPLPMTPPVDPARRTSSSRPASTGKTLRMFREFATPRPVLPAISPQYQPMRRSEEYLTWNELPEHPLRPPPPQGYETLDGDHALRHYKRPLPKLKLKRKRPTE